MFIFVVTFGLLVLGSMLGRQIPDDSVSAWLVLAGLCLVAFAYPFCELMIWIAGRKKP